MLHLKRIFFTLRSTEDLYCVEQLACCSGLGGDGEAHRS
jgi:hypothetical protein